MRNERKPDSSAARVKPSPADASLVVLGCGGTGGHVFPAIAIAEALETRGAQPLLLVSAKAIDHQATSTAPHLRAVPLPAVGLERGRLGAFVAGFLRSFQWCRLEFRRRPPAAVLAMGGFTSAPPVLAARLCRTPAYLHEANAIPGRANRWLAHVARRAFTFFPQAARRLAAPQIDVLGMPVRPQFQPLDPEPCRLALGLRPNQPVVLIAGGSQGASGLNQALCRALPLVRKTEPDLQFLHLTGPADEAQIRDAYRASGATAVARAFLTEMELALGAATVVIGRAGASFLAEIAAMRVPALLIPFPAAVDNHQHLNACAWVETGAASLLPQAQATPETLQARLSDLLHNHVLRQQQHQNQARWHQPDAADCIADALLAGSPQRKAHPQTPANPLPVAIAPLEPHDGAPSRSPAPNRTSP
ncbi:MAG TPA: UDP-N-acetylglucosamine--N-acetylmuramyl-(pentapeptide) pyrophosphoryl-undecaprenol N-acetylglucosamine transferase [Verrucomicrobiota bacterium]|nr:UDP-N-acetylglucosamine--N-acetylmuramyl-(pentapeptide) pyrophosphoryl-undecaprenol N-acetylglucosamine transferase [Verrucomicrobiota bacterium]HNU52753.1 UDP-N-acetylglucosamine--N-acetylmuramyl-(pentapeptide) pyrophosphoryl-undecaprenol N-acetylglucosamine transferase [Verrucomicrobiota bacterium]